MRDVQKQVTFRLLDFGHICIGQVDVGLDGFDNVDSGQVDAGHIGSGQVDAGLDGFDNVGNGHGWSS